MGLHLFGYTQMSVFLTRISSFFQYNRHLGNLLHVKGQLCAFTFFNTLFIHYLTFRGFCWVFLCFHSLIRSWASSILLTLGNRCKHHCFHLNTTLTSSILLTLGNRCKHHCSHLNATLASPKVRPLDKAK